MKNILAGLLLAMATAPGAHAQFEGTLVYEDFRSNIVLTMVYSQTGSSGFMAANNINIAGGKPDTSSRQCQDTILWDFNAQTETHLQQATHVANKTAYHQTMMANALKRELFTCKTVGPDSANGYNCMHYIVYNTIGRFTRQQDVWIATSLGVTPPSVYVTGDYQYQTPGSLVQNLLTGAGGNGIVVKIVISNAGKTAATINLVKYDPNKVKPQRFRIPSYYATN